MFLTRLSNLLCVKSIVTILLTLVFGYLTITNRVSGQDFLGGHCFLFWNAKSTAL